MLIDPRVRIAVGGFLAAGVLGLLLLSSSTQRGSFASHGGPAVTGEIVVHFRADVSTEQRASVLRAHGATPGRDMLVPGYTVANVPAGSEREVGEALAQSGVVDTTEDNPVRYPAAGPNDPYYAQQWNMPMIGMDVARTLSDGSGVTVAVIDTGVAFEDYFNTTTVTDFGRAADLAGTNFVAPCNIWNASPPPDSATCPDPHSNDDYGHGTHVTGTIAQNTNNGYGAAGIAPKARIMPIKVCGPVVIDPTTNPPKKQEQCSDDKTADGVQYAVNNGADIINLSIAGPVQANQALRTALANANSVGIMVIAASGNAGASILQYPAAIGSVFSVGAVGIAKNRATNSNYGTGEDVQGHPKPLDVVAPGGDFPDNVSGSVIWQQSYTSCASAPQDFTLLPPATACRGTSMAAAHVTGVAALIKSRFPSLTVQKLKDDIRCSAEGLGDSFQFGSGLVRADRALADIDDDQIPDCIDSSVVTATPSASPYPTPFPPDNECLSPSLSPTPVTPSPTEVQTPQPTPTGPTASPRATTTPGSGVQGPPPDTGTPTDSPVATATPTDTPTATPTDTPAPSDTPTATPTDTPTPTPVPTPTPSPQPRCGDVDCSGSVNAIDALGVLEWLTESSPPGLTKCIGLGYVNCDDRLDVIDATVILRHSAALTISLPAGCSGID